MKDLSPRREDLDPIAIASRDEIEALQLVRLKWSLKHAYENVPHYRKAFDAKGVHPHDLKSLSDLRNFPFTVKQDLRENYPFGMFAVPREKVLRIHASSGTTGKPTVVGYTRNDLDVWADEIAQGLNGTRLGEASVEIDSFGHPILKERRVGDWCAYRIKQELGWDTRVSVMAHLMRSLGHDVSVAGSVAEALAATRARTFDLIVSDVGLPDGTGLDFVSAVRRHSEVPAIALTGFGSDEDVRRCLAAGFTAHLTKPINFTQLEVLIQRTAEAKAQGSVWRPAG